MKKIGEEGTASNVEKQPAEYLLENLLETIHIQLDAAKKNGCGKINGSDKSKTGFVVSN